MVKDAEGRTHRSPPDFMVTGEITTHLAAPAGERGEPNPQKTGFAAKAFPYLFILPAIVLVLGVTGYGIVYAIDFSFYDAVLADKREFVGLDNYIALVTDATIVGNLVSTFLYMLLAVPLSVGVGLVFAILVNRNSRFIGLVRTILILPWICSLLITALLWRFLLNEGYGPIAAILANLGLPNVEFLGEWAMLSLVVASVWNGYAFSMVLLLAALQQVPANLKQAARIDGASSWMIFTKITLPYIKPTLLITIVIGSLHYLNLIELPLVMTGGGPGRSTEILPLRLYKEAFSFYDTGLASAMAVLILVLNLVLTVAYFLALRERRSIK